MPPQTKDPQHAEKRRLDELRRFSFLPDDAYVPRWIGLSLFGIGSTTATDWIKRGLLDPPVQLGPQRVGFNVGKLRARLKQREEAAAALSPTRRPKRSRLQPLRHVGAPSTPRSNRKATSRTVDAPAAIAAPRGAA